MPSVLGLPCGPPNKSSAVNQLALRGQEGLGRVARVTAKGIQNGTTEHTDFFATEAFMEILGASGRAARGTLVGSYGTRK